MFRLHTNSMCTVHLCPSPTAVQSECGARDPGAPPHIFDAIERHIAARADDGGAMDVGEATHLAEAETNREIRTLPFLQRAIPMAVVDRDRAHFDAMLARIADDLRGRIKSHRLRDRKSTSLKSSH